MTCRPRSSWTSFSPTSNLTQSLTPIPNPNPNPNPIRLAAHWLQAISSHYDLSTSMLMEPAIRNSFPSAIPSYSLAPPPGVLTSRHRSDNVNEFVNLTYGSA